MKKCKLICKTEDKIEYIGNMTIMGSKIRNNQTDKSIVSSAKPPPIQLIILSDVKKQKTAIKNVPINILIIIELKVRSNSNKLFSL